MAVLPLESNVLGAHVVGWMRRMNFSKVWKQFTQLLLSYFLQTDILSPSQNRSCKSAQNRITAAPQSAGSYSMALQTRNKWVICLCLKGENGSKSVKSSLLTYSADSNQKWSGQRNNKKKKRKERKKMIGSIKIHKSRTPRGAIGNGSVIKNSIRNLIIIHFLGLVGHLETFLLLLKSWTLSLVSIF